MKKIKGTIKNSPTGGSLSKIYGAKVGKLAGLKSLRKNSPTGGSLKVKKRKRLLK
jgi:hypothetical protein